MSSAESNPELESFREQWKAEVQSRHSQQQQPQKSTAGPSSARSRPEAQAQAQAPATERHAPVTEPPRQPAPQITRKSKSREEDDDDDYAPTVSFDEPIGATGAVVGGSSTSVPTKGEPVTALEHYEKAVEREAAGNHGDSVKLYRKAFRMDDTVDQKYKNKYFSKAPPKTSSTNEPGPATAPPSSKPEQPQSMKQLIASFSTLSIAPAPPEIEGTPRPPCPIASIPDEILIHILRDVAIADVGDFVRLAQVCKRLAFLVATEDRIWRRVCLGTEFGFGGMHYYWQRQITWEPLTDEDLALEAEDATSTEDASKGDDDDEILLPLTLEERAEQHAAESTANTLAFYNSLYSSSWLRMFRLRPRIRFNGCYISTVNYVRAGQANPNLITWNTPLHIVTYYRYLRFFRDGTCISLLTTAEPASVVHHLTREAVALHAGGAAQHLPSAVVQSALKGRWRLSKAADNPGASLSEIEGDLVVETEGVSKYIYRLDLTMKTPGKRGSPKNNKLAWRGHYSYNRLTDDWAPFTLRNDKPFFFSRVKSYGVQGA